MTQSLSQPWTGLAGLEPRLLLDGALEVLPAAGQAAPWVDRSPALERSPSEEGSCLEVWRLGPEGLQLVSRNVPGEGETEVDSVGMVESAWRCFAARVQHGDGSWSHMDSTGWASGSSVDNHAPTIQIINPMMATEVARGEPFYITWDAQDADGDPLDVYLWAFSWQTGWQRISDRLDGTAQNYLWDTGAEWITEGWYCFGAWVTDGLEWRATTSPDWVEVIPPDDGGDGGDGADTSNFSAEIVAGVLEVSGTDDGETITLSMDGGYLAVERGGETWEFTPYLSGVVVHTFGGDDVVRITHDVPIGVTVYAGAGDDRIYAAGTGSDRLYGGLGDDLLITVGGGSDVVSGQDDFDSFWVDAGDTIDDASALEFSLTSVHTISSFDFAVNEDPYGYDPLEIAGQDLLDPVLTSSSFHYKDFSYRPLFVGAPGLNDINQGYLGDCYFLASLASLTLTDAHFLEQMVTELGDGTYAVRFYDSGLPTYVRVDGELPTYGVSSYSLVYADKGPQGQIWAPIAEKAYAHFRYGESTYDSLQGGWMSTVYRHVTNASSWSTYMPAKTDAALWETLSQDIECGHAMTLASVYSPENPIVGGHAYTVESISEIGGVKYVTVHNPWGVDGRSYDSNYGDGLMKLTFAKFRACFFYIVACQA